MRLAFNFSLDLDFGSFRDMNIQLIKQIKDIGFRVLGFDVDLTSTDDDIKRFNDFFGELDLEVGLVATQGDWSSMVHPDKNKEKEDKQKIIKTLEIARKIGATGLQVSIGSMDPINVWKFHPENHTQKALDRLVKNAQELAPYAEDSGCMITPETTQWAIVNSIERMKEYVDRVDSPHMKITVDFVNHMTSARMYESGRFIRCAVATLGDRIGAFHIKDAAPAMGHPGPNVVHIDEAPMGTGVMDHETMIKVSTQLEPWKLFALEHIRDIVLVKRSYDYIQGVANSIGHKWTEPHCTRERWEKGLCK